MGFDEMCLTADRDQDYEIGYFLMGYEVDSGPVQYEDAILRNIFDLICFKLR